MKTLLKILIITTFFTTLVNASTLYYYEEGVKVDVTKLDTYTQYDYYQNSNNQKIGVNNTIIVKFSSNIDVSDIESKYDVSLDKMISTNVYVFDVNSNNVFTTSSKIYEDENVEFSNPNFIKQRRRRWDIYS